MKTIELEKHKHFLNSGNAEVVAIKHSYIEGYFLKGDVLKVKEVIGSMVRIVTKKGYTCLTKVNTVALLDTHKETVHCQECKSLYKDKHAHNCTIVLAECDE